MSDHPATNKNAKIQKWLIIILSLVGIGFMAYLINVHFADHTGGSFCDIAEGLSCDIVNKSDYSVILGVPISVLGLVTFVGTLLFGIFNKAKEQYKLLVLGLLVFLGPSLYLTGIEIFVLDNICVFCEGSKLVMVAMLGVAIWAVPKKELMNLLIMGLVGAVLAGGATWLIQSNSGPKVQYHEFAQCVTDSNLVMYGSEGCSFCAKQRKMFGDGFENINEIECDARHENAQPELCVAKEIAHTPTWILEDEDGNNIYKYDPGVIELEELAERSGCELAEDSE